MSIDTYAERVLADELLDILALEAEPEAALLAALQSILTTAGRSAGVLFIVSPYETQPVWRVTAGLSADWAQQLADQFSPLRQCVEALLHPLPVVPLPLLANLSAALPIVARGQTIGALLLAGAALDHATFDRLEYLGRLLGGAVLRHWEDWHSLLPAQEAAALDKIGAALSSSLELDVILTSAVQGIGEMLNAEAVSLLLRDDQNGNRLFKKLLDGGPDWIIQQLPGAVAGGLVGVCEAEGQIILVEDASADGRFVPTLDGLPGLWARTLLLAPLLAGGQCTGAIALINKRRGVFGPRDRGLLGTLAASLANAVYNARLYHKATTTNAELVSSRAEILRSRNTLRSLVDGISSPVFIVDPDCQLVAVNRAAAELTGREPQAIIGQSCKAGLGREAAACRDCPVHDTFRTGLSMQRPAHRPARAEAALSDWLINTYPAREEGESAVSRVIVFEQDMTEQRRLEGLLAQSDKLAAMGRLVADIVHEVGNPLTAVQLNAQLLQRALPAGSEQLESADLIAIGVERAIRTVRRLLDFSRQEEQAFGPVDINLTIRQTASLLERQLRGKGIQLVFHLAEDLPRVSGSRDHLQGVWLNLIQNARDAIPGSSGEIRLSTRPVGNMVEVLIADTGDGIAPEHLARIFEPFFTTKVAGEGTGLGLSVCQRIVRQHGGDIRVESARGRGTTFTVRLPVAVD